MVSDTATGNKTGACSATPSAEHRVGDRVYIPSMRTEGVVYEIEGNTFWCRIPVYPGAIGLTRPDGIVPVRGSADVPDWLSLLTADFTHSRSGKHPVYTL